MLEWVKNNAVLIVIAVFVILYFFGVGSSLRK